MAIAEASVRLITTTTEEDESTEVVPTRIREEGRKYCCAKCYNSHGRVTHVALERAVTFERIPFVSGPTGRAGGHGQPFYTNRDYGINSCHVEVGILDHPARIREFNVVCNFCGEVFGWHYTARRDNCRSQVYWSDTLMDREKVVLLDEEENEIARDDVSEFPRMTCSVKKCSGSKYKRIIKVNQVVA
ncbi:hypothetical protein MKW94_005885 [Papaver nudicaule]|uniref:Uncharacterized protein n=1 Tax=Papaver nudicaule TaxID=74823 RepID=A0AA42AWN6_PAPNU|nr:hypothetical protein [Papaver nudicaule]